MSVNRKNHSVQFKTKVALEAIKQQKTVGEITSQYGIHATQVGNWKKKVLSVIPEAFSEKRKDATKDQQALIDELYKQIGQLTVERDWLKKNDELY